MLQPPAGLGGLVLQLGSVVLLGHGSCIFCRWDWPLLPRAIIRSAGGGRICVGAGSAVVPTPLRVMLQVDHLGQWLPGLKRLQSRKGDTVKTGKPEGAKIQRFLFRDCACE